MTNPRYVTPNPIGCMPQWRWLELQSPFYSLDGLVDRYHAVDRAIKRRLLTEFDPLPEWINERDILWCQIQHDKKWANDPIGINAFIFDRVRFLSARALLLSENRLWEMTKP